MAENINTNLENNENNEIIILDDVLQAIAAHTTKETNGVSLITSFTEGIMEKIVKKSSNKAVKVENDDKFISLEVHIAVEYGIKIPEICAVLQANIKKDIEVMTDLTVNKVDIYVDSIIFNENEKQAQEDTNSDK